MTFLIVDRWIVCIEGAAVELVKVYAGQLQGNTTREADQAYVFDDRGLLMMK